MLEQKPGPTEVLSKICDHFLGKKVEIKHTTIKNGRMWECGKVWRTWATTEVYSESVSIED